MATDTEMWRRLQRVERDLARARTQVPYDTTAWSGGRLLGALTMDTRYGGGRLLWTFNGQGPVNQGAGATAWTETSIAAANYASVTPTDALYASGGGPYVTLDGANDYLSIADAAWQEPGSEEMLVWGWFYSTSFAAGCVGASKWDFGNNNRAWILEYTGGAFNFRVSTDGTAVVAAASTYTEATDTWYFLAGYFEPSTILRVYVGAATDVTLTATDTAGAPPASIFDGTAATALGICYNNTAAASFWPGRIGTAAMWTNVPATNIDIYAQRLFDETRWAYGGYNS